MELADVVDSKSTGSDTVPVRVRPPAPEIDKVRQNLVDFPYYIFLIHYSLKNVLVDFWEVIGNKE